MIKSLKIPKRVLIFLLSLLLMLGIYAGASHYDSIPVHASAMSKAVGFKNFTEKHMPGGQGLNKMEKHHYDKINGAQVSKAQAQLKAINAYLKKHPKDKKAQQLKSKLQMALNKAKTKSTTSSNSVQSDNSDNDNSTKDPLMQAAISVSSNPSQYGLAKQTTAPGSTWAMLAGVKNGLFSQSAKDNYETDYRALYDSQGSGVKNNANIDYQEGNAAYYGLDLQNTGLDHSSAKSMLTDMFKGLGRLVGGLVPLVGNMVAWLAYTVFRMISKILNIFNPLMWVNGFDGHVPHILVPLFNTLRSFIKVFTNMGLIGSSIILFASIGFAVLGVKFANSQRVSTGQGIGHACLRFLLRTFNILILPICCLLFLNIMMGPLQKAFGPNYDEEENYAVFSNLVDDKAWIQHSRMALPGSSNGDNASLQNTLPADNINGSVPTITHDQIVRLNADGGGLPSAQQAENAGSTSKNVESGHYEDPKSTSSGNVQPSQLILMWLGNVDYSASEYSSFVKSHLNNLSGNQKGTSTNAKSNNMGSPSQMSKTLLAAKPNGYQGNIKYPFVNNGSVSAQGSGVQTNNGQVGDVSANGSNKNFSSKPPLTKAGPDTNPTDTGGLSTIGMYNYLLTIFNRNSMQWVANPSLTNAMTSTQHYSAGLAGKGFTAIGNYMMMCALIWAIALLGLAMGIFALKAIIIGIPKIFADGVKNALGSMKGAVQLVMATFALIFEVIGSAMLFSIGQAVLVAIARMPSELLGTDAYTNKASSAIITHIPHILAAGQASRGFAYPFANIGLAFLLFYICSKFIKLRGPILGSFSRMSEDIMNKVFGGIDASAGAGGGLHSTRFNRGRGLDTTGDQDNQNAASGGLLDRGLGLRGAQSKRGPNAGNGGGPGGSYNRGQANRRAQIQNPGLFGKIYNATQNAKDVMDASKGKAGRGLTTAEKYKSYAGYAAKNGAARALGAIGLGGVGAHMRSAQQAHIDNNLQDYGALKNADAQTGAQPLGSGVGKSDKELFSKPHLNNQDIAQGANNLNDQLHPGAQNRNGKPKSTAKPTQKASLGEENKGYQNRNAQPHAKPTKDNAHQGTPKANAKHQQAKHQQLQKAMQNHRKTATNQGPVASKQRRPNNAQSRTASGLGSSNATNQSPDTASDEPYRSDTATGTDEANLPDNNDTDARTDATPDDAASTVDDVADAGAGDAPDAGTEATPNIADASGPNGFGAGDNPDEATVGSTAYARPDAASTPQYAQNFDPTSEDSGKPATNGIKETTDPGANNSRINHSYQNLQRQTHRLHRINKRANPRQYHQQKARVNTARGILRANRTNAFNTFGKQTLGQKFMRRGWRARGHSAPTNVSTLQRVGHLKSHINNFNSALRSGNTTGVRHAKTQIRNDSDALVHSGVRRSAFSNGRSVNLRRVNAMQSTLNIGFNNAANGHMNPR